ncbi:MAG: DNA alkylation repair protein [Pseudomonadota bacterium]
MPTLRQELAAQFQTLADPERALQQQAYTKSAMPYAGLPAPLMRKTAREVFKRFPLHQASLWLQAIRTLWDEATVCEERYAAIELFNLPLYKKALLDASALDLLRHMVVSEKSKN